MKALLLSVGNEVLSGKIVNTNASFLAIEFEKLGIEVVKVVTIADDKKQLRNEVKQFMKSDMDLIVTTGGLGPTHDDFTKEVLFETVGLELVQRQEPLDLLNKYFQGNFAKCNLKQTLYPKEAYLLPNDKGTAMGAVCEHNNKTYAILVGPPFEMKPMVLDYLIPYLKKKIDEPKLIKEYIVMGVGESQVEDILKDYYPKYPNVEIAPYCLIGKVRYQLTSFEKYEDEFDKANQEFITILDDYIITDCNEDIELKVYQELRRLNYHISFSESSTGGMLAAKLVNVDGASNVLDESFITYSNESKIHYLGVKQETINKYDVVSEEVAIEMAKDVKKLTNAEVGCSVTGYAGPLGGTEEKPVGTVCFAIVINNTLFSKTCYFRTERNVVREKATMLIFYNLYRLLKKIR